MFSLASNKMVLKMLWVTPVYVYAVSNISMGFRIGVGVFESRGTVLYGVRVFYLPPLNPTTFIDPGNVYENGINKKNTFLDQSHDYYSRAVQ